MHPLASVRRQSAPTLPLAHAGRWITDASGRIVILHGMNMVYKLPPYYPEAVDFNGANDAAFLNSIGFNAVRVGVIWKAVEPSPGAPRRRLPLSAHRRSTRSRRSRNHGIVSLLDFHQDLYNELFQGEGAPDWAVHHRRSAQPGARVPGQLPRQPGAGARARPVLWTNYAGPGGVGLQDRFAVARTSHRCSRADPCRARLRASSTNPSSRDRCGRQCVVSSAARCSMRS